MGGTPIRRMKRAVKDAAEAIAEGREEDARRALVEVKATAQREKLPVPDMPAEIQEVWIQITSPVKPAGEVLRKARAAGSTYLTDEVRAMATANGEAAVARLSEMMEDDHIWGEGARTSVGDKISIIKLATELAYGRMPGGMQKLRGATSLTNEESEKANTSEVLNMLIRNNAAAK